MPEEWLPTTSVLFNKDAPVACSDDVALQSAYNVMSALYGMHIYKVMVADEHFCHDPNERFLIDPLSKESFCICKIGKSCNNDSTFDELFTFLLVILIFGIVAYIFTTFISLFYKRAMLYDLWGNQK